MSVGDGSFLGMYMHERINEYCGRFNIIGRSSSTILRVAWSRVQDSLLN